MPEGEPIPEGELTGKQPAEQPAETPEAPAAPTGPEEQPTVQPQPPKRRGWWPFGRRQAEVESSYVEEAETARDEALKQAETVAGQIATPQEMERLARSKKPEDLVRLFENMNFAQFREMQLNEKHGRGIAGLYRKFKAGELNFEVGPNGEIKRRIWMELAHKGAKSIFNRKTGIAVGTAAIASVLSAGVAAPAVWGIVGSVMGRGAVEGIESAYGDTAGRRQKILEADQSRFEYMKELAGQSHDENLSPEEKQAKIEELIEARYKPSKEIACEGHPSAEKWQQQMAAEARLKQSEKIWERRADIGALAGGATAMTIDFLRGLHGLADLGRFDLDGDKIKHAVRIVNEKMQYAIRWENGEAVSRAAVQQGSRFFHEIGPTAATVIPKVAAQMGVVFGNLAYWALRKRPDITTNMPEIKDQEIAEEKEAMMGRVREQAESQAAAAATPEAPAEPPIPEIPEKYQLLAQEKEKGLPEKTGEVWIYQYQGGRQIYRLTNINWGAGEITYEVIDNNNQKIGEGRKTVEDFMENGWKKSELVNDWLLGVKDGDKVRVQENQTIVDRADAEGKQVVSQEYVFNRLPGKTSQAQLAREGQPRARVNLFDLAFWGVRPIEQPAKEKMPEVKAPKAKEKWGKRSGVELPEEFRNFPATVTISDVDDGIIYFRDLDEPFEDLRKFVQYFKRVNVAPTGGEGGGRQRGRQ